MVRIGEESGGVRMVRRLCIKGVEGVGKRGIDERRDIGQILPLRLIHAYEIQALLELSDCVLLIAHLSISCR